MRPWRLTRRQRVEMEAALMALREDVGGYSRESTHRGAALLGGPIEREMWMPDWRERRARVALALRAALRADEDARCEEARAREVASWPVGYEYRDPREASESSADAMREWSACVPVSYRWPAGVPVPLSVPVLGERGSAFCAPMASRVPRALWEVER